MCHAPPDAETAPCFIFLFLFNHYKQNRLLDLLSLSFLCLKTNMEQPRQQPALVTVELPSPVFRIDPLLLVDTGDMDLVLFPFGNGSTHLSPIPLRRNDNKVNIVIGRHNWNNEAAIHNSMYVSRSHVVITVDNESKVFLSAISSQQRLVSLQGVVVPDRTPVHLPIGGRFSLLGKLNWFNYVLLTASNYNRLEERKLAALLTNKVSSPSPSTSIEEEQPPQHPPSDRKRKNEDSELVNGVLPESKAVCLDAKNLRDMEKHFMACLQRRRTFGPFLGFPQPAGNNALNIVSQSSGHVLARLDDAVPPRVTPNIVTIESDASNSSSR